VEKSYDGIRKQRPKQDRSGLRDVRPKGGGRGKNGLILNVIMGGPIT